LKTPHKHAALIKAWADGAEIEEKHFAFKGWRPFSGGYWAENDDWEYRIKPEPKPDVVRWVWATEKLGVDNSKNVYTTKEPNMKITFDGETGELKSAEVLK
jgi:hypothetical protein